MLVMIAQCLQASLFIEEAVIGSHVASEISGIDIIKGYLEIVDVHKSKPAGGTSPEASQQRCGANVSVDAWCWLSLT